MKKIITGALVAALTVVAAGTAAADDHRTQNAPVVALINTSQIDDPLEDVLEHTLNFGDGYKRD
ncbi:hypothetical protein ACWGE1_22860 [Streptomyces sp. NPDC054932]